MPLICVISEMSALIRILVLHGAQVHIQPCHHLSRPCGNRRGKGSQQWPQPMQLCWAFLVEGRSIPSICKAQRSVGRSEKGYKNKGLYHMDIHCPQLKLSITPSLARSWMPQLPPPESFLSLLPQQRSMAVLSKTFPLETPMQG